MILVAMCAIFLMGYLAYTSMRVEQNPDVSFGVVTVTTIYPGAGPEEVNTLISRKIEDAVSGISNLQEVTATSQEGVSVVILQFEIGANIDIAIADVRTKVDSVVGQLPNGAEKPVVDKNDTAASPVMTLAMRSDKLTPRELRDVIDNKIKDKFARIKGVAQVGVNGGDEREIQVQVSRDALLRYGIGIADVQRALSTMTLNVPSGRVVDGEQEYTVRLQGEFKTIDDIRNAFLSISGRQQGDPTRRVRLGDIAEVKDVIREVRSTSRLNGKDAVVVVIQKTKQGNAVEISKAIRTAQFPDPSKPGQKINLLQQIEKEYHIESEVTDDISIEIRESIADLNFTLFFGIFLVAAVVWLFLHDLRGTIIVAIAIPVCIFATFIAMQLLGFTINNLSMLALSLAIGVLVDDAIVVLENIYRHLRMGEDPREAALNGRSEIGLAAIAITMADVVVFLPIGNMGGVVGQFFRPLGIGYAVCVLFSLFVSFTVTPMLAARWYKAGEDLEHPKGRFSQWFERSFNRLADAYRRILRRTLQQRWFVFGGGFAALVALFMFIGGSFAPDAAAAAKNTMMLSTMVAGLGLFIWGGNFIATRKLNARILIGTLVFASIFPLASIAGNMFGKWKQEAVFKFAFIPPTDNGSVSINIQTAPDSSLAATEEVVRQVEKIAMEHPETEYVVANVGTQGGGFSAASAGTQFAQVTVSLREKGALLDAFNPDPKHRAHVRWQKDTSVAADLTKSIGKIPGAKITVAAQSGFGFGAAIQLGLRSDDREKLLATAVKIKDGLQGGAINGVITPDISSKPGKQELRAVPVRDRMAEANVSTAEVGSALRVLYEGDNTTKFREKGQEYDIRLMMNYADRDDPTKVMNTPITFRNGNPIYLNEIAKLEPGRGVDKIDRRDRQETIIVSAELLPGFAAGSVQSQIDEWLKKENLIPAEIAYRPLGQADTQARETGYLFGALGLGLVLVFMILAVLYENLVYPLIIQLAQPQAMIGAILALVLTDKTLNIVGMIGIIALVGLVGKNAILLVDYTNTLREKGMDREEALVESGGTRLRPIVMTTLALLVGMLPVALAIGRGSEFRETIGITIIGGTLLSTILTLLVIPCSYSIFDDLASYPKRLKEKREQRSSK